MAVWHWLRSGLGLACLLLVGSPGLGGEISGSPVEAGRPRSPGIEERHFTTNGSMPIAVRLPHGEPAAGARLHVSVWTDDESFDNNQNYTCDEQGRAEIDLPRKVEILRIWVEAEQTGYVALFANWWHEENIDNGIPEEFVFNLQKGTTIGGVIVDPAGNPIEGVTVVAELDGLRETHLVPVRPIAPMSDADSTKTDSQGRWSFDWIPAGDDFEVDLKLSHSDFITDAYAGEQQREQGIMLAALRDQSARIVMRPGVRLSGQVRDLEGKPVEDAIVMWGEGESLRRSSKIVTDKQGRFELPTVEAGEYVVAILAKDWMPVLRTVEASSESQTLDFRLKKGKTLRLKFVDPDDQPVSKVSISLERWGGHTFSPHIVGASLPSIPRRASEKGIYEWNWAPDEDVSLLARVKGFAQHEFTVTPDDAEQTITLTPVLTVTGTITDAESGVPIPKVTVMQVLHFTPTLLYVNRSDALTARNGRLEMVFHRTDAQHGIRIECEGYRTQQIGPWTIGDENPVLEIEMEPAQAVQGYVVDEGGAPVKDASVYLVTATQPLVWSHRGDLGYDSFEKSTNENGRYVFPAQFEPYLLIAATENGYAETKGRPDSPPDLLQLKPYARIEGRVFESGKPVVGQQVILSAVRPGDGPASNADGDLWTRTDSDGRYVFEKVPPVKSSLRPYFSIWRDFKIHAAQSIPLDLQPGQKVTIDLNANGRDVTGRVQLTGDVPDEMNMNWSLNHLVARREGIAPPQSLIDKGLDRGTPWTESLAKTPEGRVFRQTLHHHFVRLSPDGTFDVSGVAPGVYDFLLEIYGPPEGGCLVNPIASRLVKITVPKGEGAFDVGEITLEAAPVIHPGELVPDIAFQTSEGEVRHLSDFRGEYLLVDVWATWCAPCVAALPELETLHGKYGDELQILGLNIDENVLRAKAFLEERELAWPQGVTDDSSGLMTTLGVSSAPTYLLIDPEGRLVKKAIRLSDLEAELGEL